MFTAKVNAPRGGMAFQAMNHGLEARATSPRGSCTVIIKDVPTDVCDNCGEYYLDEETSTALLSRAEAAVTNGAEVEILRYAT